MANSPNSSLPGNPYVQAYADFWLRCLDRAAHLSTGGYWYVLSSGDTAHVAFHDGAVLLRWLEERGLGPTEALPEKRGTARTMRVEGASRSACYLDVRAFCAVRPMRKVAVMDNGAYTLGKVTDIVGETHVLPEDYQQYRKLNDLLNQAVDLVQGMSVHGLPLAVEHENAREVLAHHLAIRLGLLVNALETRHLFPAGGGGASRPGTPHCSPGGTWHRPPGRCHAEGGPCG